VNDYTLTTQNFPSIGRIQNGFVVTWTSNLQDGSGNGIYAKIYSNEGLVTKSSFLVNTNKDGDQSYSNV
jgi:hypothetical protein